MLVNILFSTAVWIILPLFSCFAAGYDSNYNNYNGNPAYNSPRRSSPPAEDNQTIIRQFKTTLSELKNSLNNHESEIRILDNRLHNQEIILDHTHQQITESIQNQQDLSKSSLANLEYKMDALDTTLKTVVSDMRQMKTQSNEFVSVLTQYKQKLVEYEKLMDVQNQHMKNLELALNSMMELMQAQEAATKPLVADESFKEYKVQAGDNLEKIARLHKVSVQSIREVNRLTKDRIFVGQTLKIPVS